MVQKFLPMLSNFILLENLEKTPNTIKDLNMFIIKLQNT